MPKSKIPSIKLRHLKLTNFKGFESFEIDFPPPLMNGDPDIIVMGSENGLGKTSIFEAIVLLTACALDEEKDLKRIFYRGIYVDFFDLLINTDADESILKGTFEVNGKPEDIELEIHKKEKGFKTRGSINIYSNKTNIDIITNSILDFLSGNSIEPVILPCMMYFNSYRKVQEGNLELGMLVEKEDSARRMPWPRHKYPISTFKVEILRALMGEKNLFEGIEGHESGEAAMKLSNLMEIYANVKIGKTRLSADNVIDIRVTKTDSNNSFSFDGLSSGQKEIISTLFLIWKNTKDSPSIVLIDEPELHLNAQWHKSFINTAIKLAPNNQYIISTHSKHIFDSVEKDRRVLLENSD